MRCESVDIEFRDESERVGSPADEGTHEQPSHPARAAVPTLSGARYPAGGCVPASPG